MASISALRLLACRSSVRLMVAAARPSFACSQAALNASRCARPLEFSSARFLTTSAPRFGPLEQSERQEIETKSFDVVKKFQGVDPEKVTMDANFIEDLGLDSLDAVEIVMAIEDEFDIEISDEEAEKIVNLRVVIECVSKKVELK